MTMVRANDGSPEGFLRTHRWWLAIAATLLTPWIGAHLDRYVALGWVRLNAGTADADRGFWVIAAAAFCVKGLVWFGVFTGLAAWLGRRQRDRDSSGERAQPLEGAAVRRNRRSSFFIALCVGLMAGAGYPLVDLGLACRAPTSEACGWGQAYLPLSLGLSVVLVGGVVTGVSYAALVWWRRRQSAERHANLSQEST